ncbi:MAG: FKBP-type peptidyl-prolyl cis-trans isomerase [Calditrichia bacterium]|nr:FKBP-type peptidyl-prolyl cis-trans isomerase [Calditrichia bacterium]
MKYLVFMLILIFVMACGQGMQEVTALDSAQDSISYSIGTDIGKNLKRGVYPINVAALAQGIKDVMAEKEQLLADKEIKEMLNLYRKEAQAAQKKVQTEQGEKNMAEGPKFLEENKSKEGVVVLPSGLQYKVLTEGTGKTPKATDKVKVHYKGTLLNGKEFDSSYKRNQPTEFPVNGVIKGWTEALLLMKEGSKWMLYIPSDLAYGPRGAGGDIGPNATLIFEVELLEVK